jgi:hypothetical protein
LIFDNFFHNNAFPIPLLYREIATTWFRVFGTTWADSGLLVVALYSLGAGESGKTTIFKQMKILEKNGEMDEKERESWLSSVYNNVQTQMRTVLVEGEKFELVPKTEDEKVRLIFANHCLLLLRSRSFVSVTDPNRILVLIIYLLCELVRLGRQRSSAPEMQPGRPRLARPFENYGNVPLSRKL